MIIGSNTFWLPYLKDIDIKSYEFPWDDNIWKDEIKKSIVKMWIGEDKKMPRAFAVYRFVPVGELLKTNEKATVINIMKLAVHPSRRNNGIGTRLLENVIVTAKLQNVKLLMVILHEENKEGRKWIIGRGFVGHNLHPEKFPDGRDGYGFVKDISNDS